MVARTLLEAQVPCCVQAPVCCVLHPHPSAPILVTATVCSTLPTHKPAAPLPGHVQDQLESQLRERGLSTDGVKEKLVVRLHEALKAEAAAAPSAPAPAELEAGQQGAPAAGSGTPAEADPPQQVQPEAQAAAGDGDGATNDASVPAAEATPEVTAAEPDAQASELPSMDDLASKTKASR